MVSITKDGHFGDNGQIDHSWSFISSSNTSNSSYSTMLTVIGLSYCTFSLMNHILFRLWFWFTKFTSTTSTISSQSTTSPSIHQTSKSSSLISSTSQLLSQDNSNNNKYAQFGLSDQDEPYERWKCRNIIVSFVHSLISGFLALYLTYEQMLPLSSDHSTRSGNLASSISQHHIEQCVLTICLSIGYFLYDLMLSLSKIRSYPDRIEIIIHHTIALITMIVIVWPSGGQTQNNQQFIFYCVLGLTIEISNVFLHLRSLAKLTEYHSKHDTIMAVNSVLAVLTIIVFRFYPLILMWLDIYTNYYLKKRLLAFTLGSLSILAFILISAVILYRMVIEDFFVRHSTPIHHPTHPKRSNGTINKTFENENIRTQTEKKHQ